jgi:Fur family ferric uptake transcriptional regulator
MVSRARELPEVRAERVAEIRAQIQAGTYETADKLEVALGRLLVEYVFDQHDHFDADALIEKLPRKGEPGYVSRPTVYRTLNEFVDAGLLRKFELAGRAVYEHDYGYPQHDHLYCQICQRLFEFQSDELIELRDRVAKKHKFHISAHRLIITGVCEQCRQAQRKRRRQDRI